MSYHFQIPDLVMGLFEFFGGVATWGNVAKIYKDKMFRGIDFRSVVFFTSWGIWNIYYYPHLGQWIAFWGGLVICLGNIAWITLAWRYRKS